MKLLFLLSLICFVQLISFGQKNVFLNLKPVFSGADFETGVSYQHPSGDFLSIDYLNYYVSDIIITHDGGQMVTASPAVFLVSMEDHLLSLGNLQVESIEHIEFTLGVPQRFNTQDGSESIDISSYPEDHPRNRSITSSKGCIQDDQIPLKSPLHTIYDAEIFRTFLCKVLCEKALYDYADDLSSINLHYAEEGRELGWHFDNSSFATTLLIQKSEDGGIFEYVENMRDADKGEMNFNGVRDVLNGKTPVKTLSMPEGTLVLFRGRNAIHRVTPTIGNRTRMLVVFAYNSEPGITISPEASMTFYGRVG